MLPHQAKADNRLSQQKYRPRYGFPLQIRVKYKVGCDAESVSSLLFLLNLPRCPGEGDSCTHTRSDLEGPAIQLNPVLIQMSALCVGLALLWHLHVRQHKANPAFSRSGNEIWYDAPNVYQQQVKCTDVQPSQQEGWTTNSFPDKKHHVVFVLFNICCHECVTRHKWGFI